MQRFLGRTCAFLLPVLAVLAAIYAPLYRSTEAWGMETVVARELERAQSGGETLFQRSVVLEEMRRHRLVNLLNRRPRIAVVGSSTSMQFRAAMFGPYAARFYNAGGITNGVHQLAELSSALESTPEILVLGIDLWWLNPAWQPPSSDTLQQLRDTAALTLDLRAVAPAMRGLVTNPRAMDWPALLEVPQAAGPLGLLPIGLGARAGDGFRGSDGSRQYRIIVEREATGAPFKDPSRTLERIRKGGVRFERATAVDMARVAKLAAFLEDMKAQGITVAGYAIPLEPEVFDALSQSPEHRGLLDSYRHAVPLVFANAGQPCVDATDVRAMGLDSDNMVDGFHGSEIVAAHILERLLRETELGQALPGLNPDELHALTGGSITKVRFGR